MEDLGAKYVETATKTLKKKCYPLEPIVNALEYIFNCQSCDTPVVPENVLRYDLSWLRDELGHLRVDDTILKCKDMIGDYERQLAEAYGAFKCRNSDIEYIRWNLYQTLRLILEGDGGYRKYLSEALEKIDRALTDLEE